MWHQWHPLSSSSVYCSSNKLAGQKIASHPLWWNLQTCLLRLFYIQRLFSSACKVLRVLRLQRGTLMNTCRRLTWKRRNCEEITWTILTMSLPPFWALNMVVALLSMQGQKALRFHKKYLHLCSENEQRTYGFGTTWGWVINDRIYIFHLWVNLPHFKG